ncbi:TRAP transporter small permease subunit [Thiohalobacter thiocyanaticus]|uniref:TRAP transporter small permease protein n=1 Tax=Thiohalobacter thiocyanaticus TaxID=585455 RepID=A0A426QJB6_9GAMM|nr:TRAP transporter small permease subunit [Thiohalobacter thiocyanaticus]RRQ21830.1 TRAP transporter small permease subunit [Thiohalobacter thiocyanaticus]
MAHPLETGARILETVSEQVGRLVAWLTLAMVLVMFTVVVLRYAFDFGRIYLQESVTWMHAAVFMLGAAYTLRHEGHVRVDIFYRRFSPRTRAWVDLLGTLVLLLPVSLYLLWTGWDYVADSWAMREGSLQTGGLPAVYLLKSLLLAMPVLLLLQGLAMILLHLAVILGLRTEAGPAEPGQ